MRFEIGNNAALSAFPNPRSTVLEQIAGYRILEFLWKIKGNFFPGVRGHRVDEAREFTTETLRTQRRAALETLCALCALCVSVVNSPCFPLCSQLKISLTRSSSFFCIGRLSL